MILKAQNHERDRAVEIMRNEGMNGFLEPTPEHMEYYLLMESHEVFSVLAVSKGTAIIRAFVTKEKYRGQGYATELVEGYAERKDKNQITISGVLSGAEGFYEQLDVEVVTP